MIPKRITQYVAPVIAPRIDHELRAWGRAGDGLDLTIPETMSLNNAYVRDLKSAELLDAGASAQAWDAAELGADKRANRKGEASWKLKSAATIYGFACWWNADLGAGITLSTGTGRAAHALGAALFSAAAADRGQSRRDGDGVVAVVVVGSGRHASRVDGGALRRQGQIDRSSGAGPRQRISSIAA